MAGQPASVRREGFARAGGESLGKLVGSEDWCSGRRELDSEGDALELTGDPRDGSGILFGEREVPSSGARALDEELHGLVIHDAEILRRPAR